MNKLQTKNAFGVFVLLVAFLAHNSPLARNIAKKQHIADSVRNLYRVCKANIFSPSVFVNKNSSLIRGSLY